MVKKYKSRYRRRGSRLSKIEEKRNLRQAVFFGFLTLVLIFFAFTVGLPLLTKMLVYVGDKKEGTGLEKKDTLAPASPRFQTVVEATNSASFSLAGFAEPDTTVEISLNGSLAGNVEVNSKGEFVLHSISLKEGKNRFKAKAIDKEDNESDYSKEINVVLDTQSPGIIISSPQNGDSFFDKDKEIMVEGKINEDTDILINERMVVSDSSGSFSLRLELKEGENTIKVKATDPAGNQSVEEIKVNYTP
ncbi:hypothetical protein COT75_00090 [Candidatus Beckwithbacteria bacterium CG10_big_fil_rev_8_21_14_0_10_34_10]|uniref:Uncharacterized protein n=1 Tax=Candidatus Beckwithbacteria bacterium CG10_big_fil_rev_8_21_14_0_10_34_10 TaxID=1974495 RepID=A0A2H0WA97_9BACT|nr:MAG: hypothetical protein COT75_00090 [Candidatus Beckwithbacteria bacterium CG10_big_fil_rev_8_21_14_0_10_34_10]